jgi:hypothetical protein
MWNAVSAICIVLEKRLAEAGNLCTAIITNVVPVALKGL